MTSRQNLATVIGLQSNVITTTHAHYYHRKIPLRKKASRLTPDWLDPDQSPFSGPQNPVVLSSPFLVLDRLVQASASSRFVTFFWSYPVHYLVFDGLYLQKVLQIMAAASPIKSNSGFQESPLQRPLEGTHRGQKVKRQLLPTYEMGTGQKMKRGRPLSTDKSSPPTSPPRKTRSSTADFRKLCEDLGFQRDFTEEILPMPEDIRDHRTCEAWIHRVMQDKYDVRVYEGDLSIISLTAESLSAIGFCPPKIQDILDRIPEQLRPYQPTIYWAQRIVSDDLFHLQKECPKDIYPVDGEEFMLNEWQGEKHASVPKGFGSIKVPLSRASRNVGTCLKSKVVDFPQAEEGNMLTLFHGTSFQLAERIIKNGIKLKRGKQCLDFSDDSGFYLDPDVDSVHYYVQDYTDRAILVYQVPQEKFTANMLDLMDNPVLWAEVVECHRLEKPVSKLHLNGTYGMTRPYADYEVVFGPWCKNVKKVQQQSKQPQPSDTQVQYLVQSDTLAEILNKSLKCVLSFPSKKK